MMAEEWQDKRPVIILTTMMTTLARWSKDKQENRGISQEIKACP